MRGYARILGNHRSRNALAHFCADMGGKPVGHSMIFGKKGVVLVKLLPAFADIASFSQDKNELLSQSRKVLDGLCSVVMDLRSDLTTGRASVRFWIGFDEYLN
jgi:hypothetical protein